MKNISILRAYFSDQRLFWETCFWTVLVFGELQGTFSGILLYWGDFEDLVGKWAPKSE